MLNAQAMRMGFVVVAVAWASVSFANEGVVEATGEANIKNGDTVAAKKAATSDALKKCIEQVVGISIKSDFSSEMQETVRGNQNEFNAKVRDTLVQKSEGFIQKYNVLDESVDGNVMKVRVQAHVYESKIKAEVKKLAELIAAAGNPKIMLVIQDVMTKPDGSKSTRDDSVLGSYLEKELLARGFELVGKGHAKQATSKGIQGFERFLEDEKEASKLARKAEADIMIYGKVNITNKGKITETGGLTALKGQTRVEILSVIRGINAASGELFSSKPTQMSSIGINMERALHRAFKGRGANLVKQTFTTLLEDLKQSFRKTASQGQSYVIMLNNVKSMRKQGRTFMTILSEVSGVQNVAQKSFDDARLTLDVQCKCTSNELQNRLFDAVNGTDLEALDLDAVKGKRISFKL